jgi:hypothetical protein
MVPISTVEAPGRAPIVVQDDVNPEDDKNDSEQTTSIFDKVEPGRNIFAGEEVKNIESKQPVPPIRPEEEPKEISSFFQTEIAGMPKEKQPEQVLLPDENAATTAPSDTPAATTPSSSTSTSTSTPSTSSSTSSTSSLVEMSSSNAPPTSSSDAATTTTVGRQPPVANQPIRPLDHAEEEAERVRQELFPAGRK